MRRLAGSLAAEGLPIEFVPGADPLRAEPAIQ